MSEYLSSLTCILFHTLNCHCLMNIINLYFSAIFVARARALQPKLHGMCQPSNSATVVFTFEAPAKLRVTKFEAGCTVLGCVKLDRCVPHEVCRPVELQKFVLGHEAAHYFLCSGTLCISRVPAAAVHQISEFCHRFT